MLSEKLQSLSVCNSEIKLQALRYSLNLIKVKEFSDTTRKYGVFKEAKHIKTNFLKSSEYTLGHLWKASLEIIEPKCRTCVFHKECKALNALTSPKQCPSYRLSAKKMFDRFQISKEDIQLVQQLPNEDKKQIIKMYKERLEKSKTSLKLAHVYKELERYCKKEVYLHAKFIFTHYWDITPDDIVGELMVSAQIRALGADTMTDELYFLNTLKNTVDQKLVNIILKYTTEKRSRISQQDDKSDNYKQKINEIAEMMGVAHLTFEEKEKRFKNAVNPNHKLTMLSLDFRNIDDADSDLGDLHDVIAKEDDITIRERKEDFINTLASQFGERTKQRRAVEILFGKKDTNFIKYLKDNGLDDSLNEQDTLKHIMLFLNLDKTLFIEKLTKAAIQVGVIHKGNYADLSNLQPHNLTLQITKFN